MGIKGKIDKLLVQLPPDLQKEVRQKLSEEPTAPGTRQAVPPRSAKTGPPKMGAASRPQPGGPKGQTGKAHYQASANQIFKMKGQINNWMKGLPPHLLAKVKQQLNQPSGPQPAVRQPSPVPIGMPTGPQPRGPEKERMGGPKPGARPIGLQPMLDRPNRISLPPGIIHPNLAINRSDHRLRAIRVLTFQI